MSGVVLLTGASGGLGKASVTELCRRGWNVIAATRSQAEFDALERSAGRTAQLEPVILDLLDEDSIQAAARHLADAPLDAIVHNAGLGASGTFEDTPSAEWRAIFQVNVLGPMALTAALLPAMRARGSGRIVGVASYTARLWASRSHPCTARPRRAWSGGSRRLRLSSAPSGSRPTSSKSGMFATPMVTGPKPTNDPNTPYRRAYYRLEPHRERIIARGAKPPEQFAKVLADTLEAKRPPLLRPVGADARALYLAQRFLPSGLMPAVFRLAFR